MYIGAIMHSFTIKVKLIASSGAPAVLFPRSGRGAPSESHSCPGHLTAGSAYFGYVERVKNSAVHKDFGNVPYNFILLLYTTNQHP